MKNVYSLFVSLGISKLPITQKASVVKKAPTSKKAPSEASYSNNRPKQSYTHEVAYKLSPSGEGADGLYDLE